MPASLASSSKRENYTYYVHLSHGGRCILASISDGFRNKIMGDSRTLVLQRKRQGQGVWWRARFIASNTP